MEHLRNRVADHLPSSNNFRTKLARQRLHATAYILSLFQIQNLWFDMQRHDAAYFWLRGRGAMNSLSSNENDWPNVQTTKSTANPHAVCPAARRTMIHACGDVRLLNIFLCIAPRRTKSSYKIEKRTISVVFPRETYEIQTVTNDVYTDKRDRAKLHHNPLRNIGNCLCSFGNIDILDS